MPSKLGKRKEREDDHEVKDSSHVEDANEETNSNAHAGASQMPHGSTLFVSNLPYTATSTDLQTLFSDLAPVRSAFVVTEHGTGVSKGVGYVSFALKEDAESVFEKVAAEGIALVGRKLRVQWADKKFKDKERAKEKTEKDAIKKEPKHRPIPPPKLPHDPLAVRTIVVSGLPSSIDSKVLWKKFRKCEGAEKVDWPVKKEDGTEDPSTAHVLFTTPAQASDAVTKLHAHVYKGALLSVTLKKRLDVLSKPLPAPTSTPTQKSDKGKAAAAAIAPSHASRLIVRNIPFNATEQDLRAVFLPYGPIYSVHIPLDKGDSKSKPKSDQQEEDDVKKEDEAESSTTAAAYAQRTQRNKGFAFVWMLSKKDAERAIEGCNGTVLRAGMAKELVEDKQKRKKMKRLEKKAAKAAGKKGKEAEGGEEGEEDEDEDMDKDEEEGEEEDEREKDDKRAIERIIAVDWALSKNKWEEEKAKIQEGEDVEMGSASDSGSASASDSDENGSDEDSDEEDEHEGLGVHSGSGDEDSDEESDSQPGSSDDEDDREGEEPVKPQLPPPDVGTTLFIRNIPFNATEDELRTLFRAFGPLRYARITLDPATGRSRGTGFACFWNKEDADRVIQQSDLLRAETTGGPTTAAPKKNPFSLPSLLTPDPSSSLAQSLVLHGRTLDCVRAVTRDVAGKLKEENERAREKADKRNMYLLREGVILPNSPAAATLTPAEIERRTSSFNARRALLKSNPSLFISKTRLSVRQIPIFVTERMLKRLVIHAIKAFNKEVKEGSRTGLTADELAADKAPVDAEHAVDVIKEEDDEEDNKKGDKKKKKKFTGRDTGVKQTKIVRQAERIDPITLKGRSKGYGFVELHKHSDALRFLRWANNNPAVGPLFEAWWKDEVEALLKAERAKEEGTRDEARIKRLKEELGRAEDKEEMGEGKGRKIKGSLIVEFSIENVQVVQRRSAMQKEQHAKGAAGHGAATSREAAPSSPSSPRKRPRKPTKDDRDKSEEPSPKKRRLSQSAASEGDKAKSKSKAKTAKPKANSEEPAGKEEKEKEKEKEAKQKFANPLGSIIGRKRKERKMGKKGKK